MPMGKGYGSSKKMSSKMPSKGMKGKDYKNGGDKSAGIPVKSGGEYLNSGYGSANVRGSKSKTWC